MNYPTRCAVLLLAALSLPSLANEQPWAQWLLATVERHPLMRAYHHDTKAADYSAAALAKPLYNPSLDTSVEKEGSETNFRIGMSSNIDWWDVRSAQTELGRLQAEQGALAMTMATNDLLAQILSAQLDAQYGREAYELARMQVEQDLRLFKLTEQQLAAGEVSNTELVMAKSVVAQGLVAENARFAEWLDAQKSLRILAGDHAENITIDSAFWQYRVVVPQLDQLLTLPTIKQARLAWLAASASADQQRTASKPVPSVGFGVGRQAGESLVSLNVSVPIQFRNDYSEAVNASREQALASEQRLHAQLRDTRENVHNLAERLQQNRQRLVQWQQLHDDEMSEQIEVLQHRYAQGDLSFADYQWQVQQLRDGLQASLTLQRNVQQTYVAYLHATAELASHISALIPQE